MSRCNASVNSRSEPPPPPTSSEKVKVIPETKKYLFLLLSLFPRAFKGLICPGCELLFCRVDDVVGLYFFILNNAIPFWSV